MCVAFGIHIHKQPAWTGGNNSYSDSAPVKKKKKRKGTNSFISGVNSPLELRRLPVEMNVTPEAVSLHPLELQVLSILSPRAACPVCLDPSCRHG